MSVAKIVELVGSSDKGWEDAAHAAVNEALKDITGYTWDRGSRSHSFG